MDAPYPLSPTHSLRLTPIVAPLPTSGGRRQPPGDVREGGGGGGREPFSLKKKLGFGVSNDDVIHNIMFSMGEAWMHEGI